MGASIIGAIALLLYMRRKSKTEAKPAPRSDNWESSSGAPNPFIDLVGVFCVFDEDGLHLQHGPGRRSSPNWHLQRDGDGVMASFNCRSCVSSSRDSRSFDSTIPLLFLAHIRNVQADLGPHQCRQLDRLLSTRRALISLLHVSRLLAHLNLSMQATGSTANTGVDVLFRNPRPTSLKKSTKYHPADSKVPLIRSNAQEAADTAAVSLDDSAMVAEDISGEAVKGSTMHWHPLSCYSCCFSQEKSFAKSCCHPLSEWGGELSSCFSILALHLSTVALFSQQKQRCRR